MSEIDNVKVSVYDIEKYAELLADKNILLIGEDESTGKIFDILSHEFENHTSCKSVTWPKVGVLLDRVAKSDKGEMISTVVRVADKKLNDGRAFVDMFLSDYMDGPINEADIVIVTGGCGMEANSKIVKYLIGMRKQFMVRTPLSLVMEPDIFQCIKLNEVWVGTYGASVERTRKKIERAVWQEEMTIIEISELEAMKKSEATRCKQFLALDEDKFRKAYGRESETYPRRCVFFGSTNDENFLTDRTGNRRYWTVPVDISKATKSIWDDLDDEVDQIWAEAVKLYRDGTPLYLSKDIEQQAVKIQNEHVIKDDREGIVQEFVSRKVPIGWDSKSLAQRLDFWADYDIIMSQLNDGAVITDDDGNDIQLVERNKVCAIEVWVECFGKSKSDIKRTDSVTLTPRSIM